MGLAKVVGKDAAEARHGAQQSCGMGEDSTGGTGTSMDSRSTELFVFHLAFNFSPSSLLPALEYLPVHSSSLLVY